MPRISDYNKFNRLGRMSIFKKVVEAGEAFLDLQIKKAKGEAAAKQSGDDDIEYYAKAVVDDPTYSVNSQGFKEKATQVQNGHLKHMSYKDSIIAAVIQTRQNQIANHAVKASADHEQGWKLSIKNEKAELEKIKEEIKKEQKSKKDSDEIQDDSTKDLDLDSLVNKALTEQLDPALDEPVLDLEDNGEASDEMKEDSSKTDDEVEELDFEMERKARQRLEEKYAKRKAKLEQFILDAGFKENKPFEYKRWNFRACLQAWARDRLTYDLIATEMVPDKAGRPSHFFPIDGSTIRYASPSLKNYKNLPSAQTNTDLLYPEKQIEALKANDALTLDESKLEKSEYKYIQLIKGKIERAYIASELKVGICNIVTDIYQNGYGLSELELLVGLVASHLNAEYYNQAYFTQGFSAKGILHLKAPINRRKLETIRQQWQHMIKGAKNSFQTPIFAGMDEVNWIPLTQNHDDIGFQNWMQYLMKMICGIFQIDPHEIGIGFKDEGAKGGISGDNTDEKVKMSKDKGLIPLLRFLEAYINDGIVSVMDDAFEFKFTGITDESREGALERQDKESKFKKTVNELRAEDGLPPIPGMDDFILNPVYFQWYDKYSKAGQAKAKQDQADKMAQSSQNQPLPGQDGDDSPAPPTIPSEEDITELLDTPEELEPSDSVTKSLTIEYYLK